MVCGSSRPPPPSGRVCKSVVGQRRFGVDRQTYKLEVHASYKYPLAGGSCFYFAESREFLGNIRERSSNIACRMRQATLPSVPTKTLLGQLGYFQLS